MITNGYNNGLLQLVGKAIQKAKIRQAKHEMVAIAICKWGGVKNPQKLIQSKGKGSTQVLYMSIKPVHIFIFLAIKH
jgi:hypothetical protein